MNSGHHMALVKKKVGRHEILFSKQRKRFCVKFVSQEKKISTKKKKFWILTTCNFPTTFQYWKLQFKKGFEKNVQIYLIFVLFFFSTKFKDERFSILLNRLSSSIYEYFKIFASHSRYRKQNNRIAMVFMFTFREKKLQVGVLLHF